MFNLKVINEKHNCPSLIRIGQQVKIYLRNLKVLYLVAKYWLCTSSHIPERRCRSGCRHPPHVWACLGDVLRGPAQVLVPSWHATYKHTQNDNACGGSNAIINLSHLRLSNQVMMKLHWRSHSKSLFLNHNFTAAFGTGNIILQKPVSVKTVW